MSEEEYKDLEKRERGKEGDYEIQRERELMSDEGDK